MKIPNKRNEAIARRRIAELQKQCSRQNRELRRRKVPSRNHQKIEMSGIELHPNTFRFLFASTAWFVDECKEADYHLRPAFPSYSRHSNTKQNDLKTSYFVLAFSVEPPSRKSIVIPSYDHVGEEVSALLGAYYGKLVVNLGHIQAGTTPCVPTGRVPVVSRYKHPFDNEPRKPDGPLLNLGEAKQLLESYFYHRGDERLAMILRAAEFYRLSLENLESRPEFSLSFLCSTLESILAFKSYSEDELYDEELRNILATIRNECKDGDRIVQRIKTRLFQIKRRVGWFVRDYTPQSYFLQRESSVEFGFVKDSGDLVTRIRKIYDLRSRALHTGDTSWIWYLDQNFDSAEIGTGSPVIDDKNLKKDLENALSLAGLERVTATVLRSVLNELLKHDDLK